MFKSIKSLNFDESMNKYIDKIEQIFNQIAEQEDTEETMLDWINNNLVELGDDNILSNLTDREKFLFALGILSAQLEQILNEQFV